MTFPRFTVLISRPSNNRDSWRLADAILQAKLPTKDKIELLTLGAKHEDNGHRLPALKALEDIDKDQSTKMPQ
jgi:HEAT repeat protein